MKRWLYLVWSLVVVFGFSPSAQAASLGVAEGAPLGPTNVSLSPNLPSGQPVGTTVTWTASATDSNPLEYRFTVQVGTAAAVTLRDFEPGNSFTWTPIQEGFYAVTVTAQEVGTTNDASNSYGAYQITSRITAGQPVVTATANPLVAIYSAPPCGKGSIFVNYGFGTGLLNYLSTPALPCSTTHSENFYIVGMRPLTTYKLQGIVKAGTKLTKEPTLNFTTGAIPSTVTFPTFTYPVPLTTTTSTTEKIVWTDSVGGAQSASNESHFYATDLLGNILWYYNDAVDSTHDYVSRPLPNGNFIAQLGVSLGSNQVLRISDPAGNPIQETSVGRLNEQITARMTTPPAPDQTCGQDVNGHTLCTISQLHHEVNLLPNGHYVILGYVEQIFPAGTQGSTSGLPVDILTDQVMDLDHNFQIDWTWNTFDWLPISRTAVLNETCTANGPGCPTTLLLGSQSGGVANDWTHTNAVVYSAEDNNLVISERHQDWILKLNYQNATGDGHVIWHLGNGGDFTLQGASNGETFPWFSHQHGLQYDVGGNDQISMFDNGNTRCSGAPAGTCDSRGQVYSLDETNLIATRTFSADMGNYSPALGWSQSLSNGDWWFDSGFQGGVSADGEEFDSAGANKTFDVHYSNESVYRIYRLSSFYSGCCGD
jgi:hypothetical protein